MFPPAPHSLQIKHFNIWAFSLSFQILIPHFHPTVLRKTISATSLSEWKKALKTGNPSGEQAIRYSYGTHSANYQQVNLPRKYKVLQWLPILTASYRQITSKLIFLIFLNQTTRYCSFLFLLIPTSFLVLTINKLLASYYAQKGIYFIYLGAVFGSSGFINCNLTASLIKREILPADESFMPKRSLKELFVNCSPCTCLIHACR